jgi:hypothetical protein
VYAPKQLVVDRLAGDACRHDVTIMPYAGHNKR